MAEFSVLENTKSCELCETLAKQKSFKKGSRVRVSGAFDCENCQVYKSRPIRENEVILTLFNLLPVKSNFSGMREITAEDIQFIFKLNYIHEDLWQDYYNRIMFLNQEINIAYNKKSKSKKTEQEVVGKWKKERLASMSGKKH